MYTLTKKDTHTYLIVLRDREIGAVSYADGNWFAKANNTKMTKLAPSRKKAVEGLLYEIIMLQLNKDKNRV